MEINIYKHGCTSAPAPRVPCAKLHTQICAVGLISFQRHKTGNSTPAICGPRPWSWSVRTIPLTLNFNYTCRRCPDWVEAVWCQVEKSGAFRCRGGTCSSKKMPRRNELVKIQAWSKVDHGSVNSMWNVSTLTSILTQLGTLQGIPGQISFPHAHVSVLAQPEMEKDWWGGSKNWFPCNVLQGCPCCG